MVSSMLQALPIRIPVIFPDDWIDEPTFRIGEKVKVLDENHPSKWEEYILLAVQMVPGNSSELAPTWLYGVRCSQGTKELIWFEENEICKSCHAHLHGGIEF